MLIGDAGLPGRDELVLGGDLAGERLEDPDRRPGHGDQACDEDWCRILSQSLVLLWAGHSGSGSSCHPWLVSQARSAVGWFVSCLRS